MERAVWKERGANMSGRAIVLVLFVMAGFLGANENISHAAIPDSEMEGAQAYIRKWVGDEVYESSISYKGSNTIGSGDTVDGYYVSYLFCPRTVEGTGVYALLAVMRWTDGEWMMMDGSEPPECAKDPSLCDVLVRSTEAVHVAQDHGFAAPLECSLVHLRWSKTHRAFVWEVSDAVFEDVDCRRSSIEFRTFVVSAKSDSLLAIRGGTTD